MCQFLWSQSWVNLFAFKSDIVQWEITVRRKCEYGIFLTMSARKFFPNHEAKPSDLEGIFWHKWWGKSRTHISDLTVITLLKITNNSLLFLRKAKFKKKVKLSQSVGNILYLHFIVYKVSVIFFTRTLHFTKCQ